MQPCAALIKQIHDHLEKNANNAMRPLGLTMAQLGVVLALSRAEDGQLTLKEVEQSLHVAQSTAAGIVARLEQKGFVQGFTASGDRRVKMVRITPEGLACCAQARCNMDEAENGLLAPLTDTERDALRGLLQKVCNGME